MLTILDPENDSHLQFECCMPFKIEIFIYFSKSNKTAFLLDNKLIQLKMGVRSPIFINYAHNDQHYLDKLLTHLEPLRMQNKVCAWSDKELEAGSQW